MYALVLHTPSTLYDISKHFHKVFLSIEPFPRQNRKNDIGQSIEVRHEHIPILVLAHFFECLHCLIQLIEAHTATFHHRSQN